MRTIEELIADIDKAVSTDDGVLLDEAWSELYALNKAEAFHIAMILKPLARVS